MAVPALPFFLEPVHTEFKTTGWISSAGDAAKLNDTFWCSEFAGLSGELTGGDIERPPLDTAWPGPGVCYFYTKDPCEVTINGEEALVLSDNDKGMDNLIASFAYNDKDVVNITNTKDYYVRRYSSDRLALGVPVRYSLAAGATLTKTLCGNVIIRSGDREKAWFSADGKQLLKRKGNVTYARGSFGLSWPVDTQTDLVNESTTNSVRVFYRPYKTAVDVSEAKSVVLQHVSIANGKVTKKFTATKHCFFACQAIPIARKQQTGPGTYTGYVDGPKQLCVKINNGPELYDNFYRGMTNSDYELEAYGPSCAMELFKGDVVTLVFGDFSNGTGDFNYFATVAELNL